MTTGVGAMKNVGAKFGKMLVEGANANTEIPGRKGSPMMLTDNGSSNGGILPPTTRSLSSDSRSVNGGRFPEKHYFVQHNYIRPTRCEGCDEKMWGREYKCQGENSFFLSCLCRNNVVHSKSFYTDCILIIVCC